MNNFSKVLVCACAGALIAGCGSAPYRSGKGNDHQVMYRPANVEETKVVEAPTHPRVVETREVTYVHEPHVSYQPAPTYQVVTARPGYSTVTSRPVQPAYRYVPVTRYNYYD
jgi:hypothetical protein